MARRRILAEAADSTVRSALAVRPWRPITRPEIGLGDLQLVDQRVRLLDLLHLHLIGVFHERTGQKQHQLAQRAALSPR